MSEVQDRQKIHENFEVPDPIRIDKAMRFIRSVFPSAKGLRVLECGAAKGGVGDRLAKDGAEVYGIDIYPREMQGVKMLTKDLNDGFPEFPEKFDIIFAGELLEHIFDDNQFIRSARELLKPGGYLILTVPNLVFGPNRILMLFGKTPLFAYAPYHYHFYTKKALSELIKGEGLDVIKTVSSHVLFSTRRNKFGKIFEALGDYFPSFGAHLIMFAQKPR